MASRERRKPFIRTRSPTPPWLKRWDDYSTIRVPFEEPHEKYRRPRPYDARDHRRAPLLPDPDRKIAPDQRNSRSTYGSWNQVGAIKPDGDLEWRRGSPYPMGYNDGNHHNEEYRQPLLPNPSAPAPRNPIINDSVESVVSKLVDMVTKGKGFGNNLELPFNQDVVDGGSGGDYQVDNAAGDFSTDDANIGMQFVGLNSRSLEDKEVRRGRGLYCGICDLAMAGIEQYQGHLLGTKHKRMLKKRGLDDEIGTPSQARVNTGLVVQDNNLKILQCVVCGEECHSNSLAPHITKQTHLDVEERWRALQRPIPRFIDMFVEKGSVAIALTKTDVPFCKICDVTVSSFEELEVHMKGRKHLKMAQKLDEQHKPSYYCKVCDIHATSESGLQDHYNGKKHALKVLKINEKPEEDESLQLAQSTAVQIFSCDVCNVRFCASDELKEHYTKEEHFINIKKKAMEVANVMPSTVIQQPINPYAIPLYYPNPYIPYTPMYYPATTTN